ncbi:DUF2845 domain-containing protein [Jeongeupia chitinilytica]|nr:DUF2845 domain-containing protein [Jeongeupia chitinilytica]
MNYLAIVTFATALYSASAAADSFRCQNDLVYLGDSKAAVLQKCGEPLVKDAFCETRPAQTTSTTQGSTVVNVATCENVDEWTYNPGSGKFMTTLRFESGKLANIKLGDRAK